jgi:mannose-6-phosphate isomerase
MKLNQTIFLVSGVTKNYDWGSKDLIPNFLNKSATDMPVAEVWFGSHEKGSSLLSLSGAETDLSELIRLDPVHVLGESVNASHNSRLPFLFKFLGIEKALSVQVHPNLEEAKAGFERENQAGIPIDSNVRIYVDEYDKPEQICALSEVWALCGFRPLDEILHFCSLISIKDKLSGNTPGDIFLSLFDLKPGDMEIFLDLALDQSEKNSQNEVWQWVNKLIKTNPGDITALSPLFMNLVHLNHNESLFLEAGTVHAYLSGLAIEGMGASDNVIRAGLTSKNISIRELRLIMNKQSTIPEILDVYEQDAWNLWPSKISYFQMGSGVFKNDEKLISGPAIITLVDGNVSIANGDESVELINGDSAYICGDVTVRVFGNGKSYFCRVNHADYP